MSGDLPTLFSKPESCALALDIALRWARADYNLRVLQPGEAAEPALLAINPTGEVPALKLKGQKVLTGVQALLLLVADSHPESDLAPSSSEPVERYRLEQLLAFMTCDVHEAITLFLVAERLEETDRPGAEITRAAPGRALRLLAQLEARLSARASILSKRTVADPFLYVLARWAEAVCEDWAELPNLERFRLNMECDAAVAASLHHHRMTTESKPRQSAIERLERQVTAERNFRSMENNDAPLR